MDAELFAINQKKTRHLSALDRCLQICTYYKLKYLIHRRFTKKSWGGRGAGVPVAMFAGEKRRKTLKVQSLR
jgi:hypothetical protein